MTRTILLITLCAAGLACSGSDSKVEASAKAAGEPAATKASEAADPGAKAAPAGYDQAFGPVAVDVSDAAKATAKDMLTRLEDDYLDSADIKLANAEALVWIAATADKPAVVAGALDELGGLDGALPPSMVPLLTARLRVKDPVVLEGAGALLEYSLSTPDVASDATFVGFVAKAAVEHPNLGVRVTAAAALTQLPSDSRHLALALPALDAGNEPAALYALLKNLQLPNEGPVVDGYVLAATKLLAHPAPEVRGIAAAKLGRAASREDAKSVAAVVKLLTDDVPYVRCQAARGVGALRAKAAITELLAMLDDDAVCGLSVDDPNYDGTSRKRPLPFGKDPLAMIAALAIKDISLSTKDRLGLVRVDPTDKAAVKTLVAGARAWAKKHG